MPWSANKNDKHKAAYHERIASLRGVFTVVGLLDEVLKSVRPVPEVNRDYRVVVIWTGVLRVQQRSDAGFVRPQIHFLEEIALSDTCSPKKRQNKEFELCVIHVNNVRA